MCRALHVSVLSSQEAVRMYIPLYLYYLSGSTPRMHSFETVWWNSRSRFKHCAMHAAIRSPKLSVRDGIISTLRFLLNPAVSSAAACVPGQATRFPPRRAFHPRCDRSLGIEHEFVQAL